MPRSRPASSPWSSPSSRLSARLLTAVVGATALVATGGVAHAAPARTTTIAGTLPAVAAERHRPVRPAHGPRLRPAVRPRLPRTARRTERAAGRGGPASRRPAPPSYGHFLSQPQYEAAYGPTQAAATTVSRYLTSAGLHVDSVEADRRYVAATGTRRQLQRAFGVTLASFTHDGAQVVAPTTAASLPTDVAADVLTVSGLDTSVQRMTSQRVTERPPRRRPPPTTQRTARRLRPRPPGSGSRSSRRPRRPSWVAPAPSSTAASWRSTRRTTRPPCRPSAADAVLRPLRVHRPAARTGSAGTRGRPVRA